MSERPSSKPEETGRHRYDIMTPTIGTSQLCKPRYVSDPLELCHAVGLVNGVDRRRRKPVRRSQATVQRFFRSAILERILTLMPQLTESKTLMYAATCGYEKSGNDGCVQPVSCVGGVTWICATVYRALR
jgi:hypothetical protein